MTLSQRIEFGTTTIAYHVRFTRRTTVAIEVLPDTQVLVTAPEGSDLAAIETFLHRRAPWIVKQQRQFATYAPPDPPRAFVSGACHRYLGRQYRLKVQESIPAPVRLERGFIYVTVADKTDSPAVRSVLDQWYRTQAQRIFEERLSACYPRVKYLGLPYPPFAVRPMKLRWGSCSRNGLITLNLRLIQAPTDCIDYVILHELCHLKEHNHGKTYYALLDQVLPGWRERRHKLSQVEFS